MSPAKPSDVLGPLPKPDIMSQQAVGFSVPAPSETVPRASLFLKFPVLWVFWANALLQSHSDFYVELVPSTAERGLVNRENRRSHLLKICRRTNSIHHHWHHWFSQSGWLVSRHNASQTHGLGLGNQETTIFFPSIVVVFFFFFNEHWVWMVKGTSNHECLNHCANKGYAQCICHVN